MQARRASVEVFYNGKNISEYIHEDFISFSYKDNASGIADDIAITLKDDKDKWLKEWITEPGDSLQAKIIAKDWRESNDLLTLDCGKFIVDEPTYSDPPSIFNLNCISIPSDLNFKDCPRSRIWKSASLKKIAQTIADNSKITLSYEASLNPTIKTVEQSEQPDMEFLLNLCSEYGLKMKVYNTRLIIFSEQESENRESILTISKSMLKSCSLKRTLAGTGYDGCKLVYKSHHGKKHEYAFYPPGSVKQKVYLLNEQVDDMSQAVLKCKSKLRELNRDQYTIDLSFMGDIRILAGLNITLNEDFGIFKGKYAIDTANHDIGNGFDTSLTGHRVLVGY